MFRMNCRLDCYMIRKETTREQLRSFLGNVIEGASVTRICRDFDAKYGKDLDSGEVLLHIEHLRRSMRNEEGALLVRPPECRSCGFNGFDELVNIPSQCPECQSEWIREPSFMIE